jgi:hypothetical protein
VSALAIALHVLVAATAEPRLRLETPLELRLAAAQPAAPDLAPPPIAPRPGSPGALASERPLHVLGVRPGAWAAAAGVTAVVDSALVAAIGIGVEENEQLLTPAPLLLAAGGIAYLFVPPMAATWGAQRAGAPVDRRADAWARGTVARFLGAAAAFGAAALARGIESDGSHAAERPVFVGTLAFSELIVMPWVVARTLGDEPDAETPADPVEAQSATRAHPVHDPALASR